MKLFDTTSIIFPGLGIEIDPPEGFCLPGTDFEIKFYGAIIALGVVLAVAYALWQCRRYGLTSDDIYNIVLVGIPCAIVGARMYYVISRWDSYFAPGVPWYKFLSIRDGGLAIYGGILGAVAGLLVFFLSRRARRGKLLASFDIGGFGLLIGQLVGRWGNFFNREAFGSYTDNPLAMRISESRLHVGDQVGKDFLAQVELLRSRAVEGGYAGMIQVHPTFLYESLWNLAGLVLLHFLSRKRRFDGQMFLCYLFWYGLGRTWIEGLRMDSLGSGAIRYSQVLAIVSCVLAAGAVVWMLCVKKPDPERMLVHRRAREQAGTEE